MSVFDERYKMYGNLGNSFGSAFSQLLMAMKQRQDQEEANNFFSDKVTSTTPQQTVSTDLLGKPITSKMSPNYGMPTPFIGKTITTNESVDLSQNPNTLFQGMQSPNSEIQRRAQAGLQALIMRQPKMDNIAAGGTSIDTNPLSPTFQQKIEAPFKQQQQKNSVEIPTGKTRKNPDGSFSQEYTMGDPVTGLPIQNANIFWKTSAPAKDNIIGTNQGFDAKVIAEQIKSGQLPPTSSGFSRGQWGVIASEIGKDKSYNLSTAQTDWNATQKHFATLNNPQQTRLRQAAQTAYDSFDVIDGLANEWNGGKFPLLNKANLILAKNGALGEKAQSVATRLEAQINDVVSEMSQVYTAGNTPTDHALKLAAKNLSSDWSLNTLKDALNLGRKNMQIRLNSINNIGTISPSGDNNKYIQQDNGGSNPVNNLKSKYGLE